MDSNNNVRERIEALERQTEQWKHQTEALEAQTQALTAHTRTVERRLRWWRGLACGVMVLSLVSGALLSGKPVDAQQEELPERVTALENKLVAVTFNAATQELVMTGANLRLVNGLGSTETTNGLGNLLVGYNEGRASQPNTRTGSHNVVVGREHNFSRFGGIVVGLFNEISGEWAAVSGGSGNTASGFASSVSGGLDNTASGIEDAVSGGLNNRTIGNATAVSGGINNTASGVGAAVSGGSINTAAGTQAAVSGGRNNTASGLNSSVSGGEFNTASGDFSSVSGGSNRTAPGTDNWVAGPWSSRQG